MSFHQGAVNYKRVIVTTTINEPTEALLQFASKDDWHLVVVGDLKTPADFFIENATYLSPGVQHSAYSDLSDLIGWNSIQRRNLGFLWALESGAEIIATVDDDNVPHKDWGRQILLEEESNVTLYSSQYSDELIVFDPISVAGYPNLWHRGFPLQLLRSRNYSKSEATIRADIQAAFWNGDPDIDAVCRMEHAPACIFDEARFPFSFAGFSPFNSQNTFLTRKALKHYFMIPLVGRMDDIWASYYLQSLGYKTVYSHASVTQVRNEHNLTLDFEREIDGYLHTLKILEGLKRDPTAIHSLIPFRASQALSLYLRYAQGL